MNTDPWDVRVVTTTLSLGPCSSQHVLEEMAVPVTPDNIQRVVKTLQGYAFQRHGAFWFH